MTGKTHHRSKQKNLQRAEIFQRHGNTKPLIILARLVYKMMTEKIAGMWFHY